jgi:hypothetical protein
LTEISSPQDEYEIEDSLDEPFDSCSGLRLIVIGGSHASRTVAALENLEVEVVDLTTPGWTITEHNVEKLVPQLENVLAEETNLKDVVVYHMFDNSIFLESSLTVLGASLPGAPTINTTWRVPSTWLTGPS